MVVGVAFSVPAWPRCWYSCDYVALSSCVPHQYHTCVPHQCHTCPPHLCTSSVSPEVHVQVVYHRCSPSARRLGLLLLNTANHLIGSTITPQAVELAEAAVCMLGSSPAPGLALLLLQLAARRPDDDAWMAWLLPLLSACCCEAMPPVHPEVGPGRPGQAGGGAAYDE